MTMEKI